MYLLSNMENFTPINILLPHQYEKFDEGEIKLICKLDALPLVLIEDASEIMRRWIQDYNDANIEKLLKMVSKSTGLKNAVALPSHTFSSTQDNHINIYRSHMKYILQKKKNQICYTLLGVQLKNNQGHYGMVIYDSLTGEASIFDAMQQGSSGPWTNYFMELAHNIFDPKIMRVLLNVNSFQPTGGFISPLYSDIEIQNEDSQNHFCYMWALFSLHMLFALKTGKLNQGAMLDFIKSVEHSPMKRLCAIKFYIYYITALTLNKNNLNATEKTFIERHFLKVWHVSKKNPRKAKLCQIVPNHIPKTPLQCLRDTITQNYSITCVPSVPEMWNDVLQIICPTRPTRKSPKKQKTTSRSATRSATRSTRATRRSPTRYHPY